MLNFFDAFLIFKTNVFESCVKNCEYYRMHNISLESMTRGILGGTVGIYHFTPRDVLDGCTSLSSKVLVASPPSGIGDRGVPCQGGKVETTFSKEAWTSATAVTECEHVGKLTAEADRGSTTTLRDSSTD